MSPFASNKCDNHTVETSGSNSGDDAADSSLLRCYEMWVGK